MRPGMNSGRMARLGLYDDEASLIDRTRRATSGTSVTDQVCLVLQVVVFVAVAWRGITHPDLSFLPLLACAGLAVAGITVMVDHVTARRERSSRPPEPWKNRNRFEEPVHHDASLN